MHRHHPSGRRIARRVVVVVVVVERHAPAFARTRAPRLFADALATRIVVVVVVVVVIIIIVVPRAPVCGGGWGCRGREAGRRRGVRIECVVSQR